MGNFRSQNVFYHGYSAICKRTKWITSYIAVIFRKRRLRMFKYDFKADGQPLKVGFFIPQKEWDLECLFENQEADEMFCFGINSDGECLIIQIARECICDSSSLFLKINGCTYKLPTKLNFLTVDDKKTYGNNRFYMKCIAPFRKWRIFFNGVLRENNSDTKEDRIVHVRFSFIWVASSGVFDFTSDYSSCNITDILSKIKWSSLRPPINRLLSVLNEYHQPGMLLGFVQIEDQEQKKVVMWGSRHHTFGALDEEFENLISLFGNIENGCFFYFKIISLKVLSKRNVCGYIMLPNGSLKAVQFITIKKIIRHKKTILFFRIKADGLYYNISAFFYGYGEFFGKKISENLDLSVIDVLVNGVWGSGIAIERTFAKSSLHKMKCLKLSSYLKSHSISDLRQDPLIVMFDEKLCSCKHLTGNLGSSLSKLTELTSQISQGYNVPEGFVITTVGYEEFYSSVEESILILKENFVKYDADQSVPLCERIVEEISNSYFPPEVYDILCEKLNEMMMYLEIDSFNIFPSITGLDPEAQLLSAYLEMFSDVVGLCNIVKSIKKCWASQFSFGAVKCKMSTGQLINVPMAIVVQIKIPYKASGVITTCDSQTGNPSVMIIREEIEKFNTCITLLERGLTDKLRFIDNALLKDSNLTKQQAWTLGKLACKLEKGFRLPLCIEWGLKDRTFYIIQVRPMTLVNEGDKRSTETKLEIMHYYDSYIRTEDEWLSTLNTGEAILGVISPLGMNLLNFCIEILIAKSKWLNSKLQNASQVPYFPKLVAYSHYHIMYCISDGILRFQSKSKNSIFKNLPLVMNFKHDGEEELLHLISSRHGKRHVAMKTIWHFLMMIIFPKSLDKMSEVRDYVNIFNIKDAETSIDILNKLACRYQVLTQPFICYINCIVIAVFWNILVLHILRQVRRDKSKVDAIHMDFNYLLSALSVPKEGDITLDILDLSNRIASNIDPKVFKKMDVKDAKIWLEDSEVDEKVKFSSFLKKHGHIAFKEVDILEKCWKMDSSPVVQALQVIVQYSPFTFLPSNYPLDPIFNQLSGMPNCFQKVLLKYTIARYIKSLKEMQKAKSNLLKVAGAWREAFHHLACKAFKEFRIPFPEALFLLSLDEIKQLLTAESPHLVSKALKCWEIFANLDKYHFPVMMIGLPFPLSEKFYSDKRFKIKDSLKGFPMCAGTVIGTAVVVQNLNEITDIEKGSILITSTASISWSLYFPVLGGFAADLGGMLSEGAIAAREFGLPCVTNLIRASKVLKTGDRVYLDGCTGVLRRISDD